MQRSSIIFLAIAVMFCLPAYADASIVYETGNLSVSNWYFHFSRHRFDVDNPQQAILEVSQPLIGPTPQAGYLFLNRKLIPLRSFVHRQTDVLTQNIQLRRHNRLRVFLIGRPGASLSITIHGTTQVSLPEVEFSASPETITSGAASTLSWTSKNADTCIIQPDIGAFSLNGTQTVSPGSTTTYTLTASGPGGTTSASVTITVNVPRPSIDFSIAPSAIKKGDAAILSWSTTHADRCFIEPVMGSLATQGELSVSPPETTQYTVTASGPGGTSTDSAMLTVYQTPVVNISAYPESIAYGESATLSWSCSEADTAAIDPNIGSVSTVDSISVNPDKTTIYTITATGPGGTASAQARIEVQSFVEPLPDGSFGKQYEDLIPADATIEAYAHNRFALITGLVRDASDLPISGVFVGIHKHEEYGTVATDDQGRFTIPVEGGSTMTVVYKKAGLITSHRQVYVPWNDIAIADTVQLIAEDTEATTVTFDDNPNTIVTHRSTPVVDEFGSRSATMVFTGDNRAWLVDENGNDVRELTTITTRATEFATPESMPAKLPPTSAYTYCAELSVDGAERVRFAKPVVVWVDNFLGFEVGEIVPVGYYDRDRGVWVPSDNGVVVRLLDTDSDGIVDALDSDSDGLSDDLNGNGSYIDEVIGLEDFDAYKPDTTYWRATVSHFTPWDCNWPFGPPEDAISPNPEGEPTIDQELEDDCKGYNCSFVEERSRIFHEEILIPGTDIVLHYASNRVDGYNTIMSVPASGETVPASLHEILVKIELAGRQLIQKLAPLPDQKAEVIWDGLDHLGNVVDSTVTARISVGFSYFGKYYEPGAYVQAFGQPGSGINSVRARTKIILWKSVKQNVFSSFNGKGDIAKGWTIASHHRVNPVDTSTSYKGDGTRISSPRVIETIAGVGRNGFSGDGGLATEARIHTPAGVAVDSKGNIYIADWGNSRIRKIDTSGIITTVAGNGDALFSGDDGPAIDAGLSPSDVTVDSAGNIFIADSGNHRIRRVDTDGMITTVAGIGNGGFSGDGGPAKEASLHGPAGVAVNGDGNLIIADSRNHRIRKVDTNGIITTVAGTGTHGFSGDGGPATDAQLNNPVKVAVGSGGNLFISDNLNHRIRMVDTSGIITTVAGRGDSSGSIGDGDLATIARLHYPKGIALDIAGNLFIADNQLGRVRKVDTHGIISTVAGYSAFGFSGDGGPPTQTTLYWPTAVAVDSVGNLLISDEQNQRIRKVGSFLNFGGSVGSAGIFFAEDNGLGHIVSSVGLHKETFNLDTGVIVRRFSYDEDDRLVAIVDQFGNQTDIDRDGSGFPTTITSPDGLTTHLTIDSDNHLTRIFHKKEGKTSINVL